MNALAPRFVLPERLELESGVTRALDAAARLGASAADASLSVSRGLSVTVRRGEVDSLEFHHDRGLSLTVYDGHRSGSASSADLTAAGIAQAAASAWAIARASGEDNCNGLADASRMATLFPDLDLDHPWNIAPDEAIERARECEAAALAVNGVAQTEGASLHTSRGLELYGNSHGFIAERRGSEHYLACSAIVQNDGKMQRDDWYSTARHPGDLESEASVGRRAGERAVARTGARQVATQRAPVLFVPEMARGFWGHFVSAVSGGALYRKASFLLDKLGQPVFAPWVRLSQQPFIPRGASSAAFDQEGVATTERTLVEAGVLQGYLLGSYTARKLGMESTGNAGGVFNLVADSGPKGFEDLLREMDTGLVVTELMGQGVNPVTGDYSRGAAGYWVEKGERVFPVEEITIAGNLPEMFRAIRAVGNDVDARSGIHTGSVLIDAMTIAGN